MIIDGKYYTIIKDLGFVNSIGYQVKLLKINSIEHFAIKQNGFWRLWTPEDRKTFNETN